MTSSSLSASASSIVRHRSSSLSEPYLLGQSNHEAQRLLDQARFFHSETRDLLDSIDLPIDARAVDIGCGPLGILDELALRVGPDGLAAGLEREKQFCTIAESELDRRGLEDVTVLEGDARSTKLPDRYFDLSHARLLLVNLPRPYEVVDEMVRITKPGGAVALHEVDWVSWLCEPLISSWSRLKEAAADAWRHRGLSVSLGRRLPGMLRRAGLADIEFRTQTYAWHAGDLKQDFLLSVVRRIRSDLRRLGHFAEGELDDLIHDLEAHLSDPDTVVISPTYVQAWGYRPDES